MPKYTFITPSCVQLLHSQEPRLSKFIKMWSLLNAQVVSTRRGIGKGCIVGFFSLTIYINTSSCIISISLLLKPTCFDKQDAERVETIG